MTLEDVVNLTREVDVVEVIIIDVSFVSKTVILLFNAFNFKTFSLNLLILLLVSMAKLWLLVQMPLVMRCVGFLMVDKLITS